MRILSRHMTSGPLLPIFLNHALDCATATVCGDSQEVISHMITPRDIYNIVVRCVQPAENELLWSTTAYFPEPCIGLCYSNSLVHLSPKKWILDMYSVLTMHVGGRKTWQKLIAAQEYMSSLHPSGSLRSSAPEQHNFTNFIKKYLVHY